MLALSGNVSSNPSHVHIVIAVTNGVSVVVCLLAAVLVFRLKLYKKAVYRLALYQVLASLILATFAALQVIFVNEKKNQIAYAKVCIAIGWFLTYSQWMKLMFTAWVTFHLFCFAVLHHNMKKLEVLYVVTSLLVPLVIAAVPLVTYSYGLSADGAICNVYANKSLAPIERYVLWDGPAMLILLVASVAMVVMVIKLTFQVCKRLEYKPITDNDKFWSALKQLLPLAVFPILFFLFEIPVLSFHIYVTKNSAPNTTLEVMDVVFYSFWTMSSGGMILAHIAVVQCWAKKKKKSYISLR